MDRRIGWVTAGTTGRRPQRIGICHPYKEKEERQNGFSRRNLYAIRQWYLFYNTVSEFVPQVVAQIPWGHNRLIISKIKNTKEALFYCNATAEND